MRRVASLAIRYNRRMDVINRGANGYTSKWGRLALPLILEEILGPKESLACNKNVSPGDDVVIIKDLKLDGKSGGIKVGTKVRSIRLVPGDHPIQGKVDGRTVLIIADKVKLA